jgi:N-acetylglucosaminyl-diphospho-decaprenol L-rhamnosyltransferase
MVKTINSIDVPSSDNDEAPSLEIVIVAFRSFPILQRCLQSLRDNVSSRMRVVIHVVDNASGDGTADAVASEFPEVVLYRQASNDGFAAGNNRALRCVTAPFVLVLNPDTEVPEGVLEHLFEVLDQDSSIGVIGCRLVRDDGTFDHASKRSFPNPRDALEYFFQGRDNGPSRYLSPNVPELGVGSVDAINGAFMLIRSEAMQEVGLLDQRYWMYGEDLDWCKRFSDLGWNVVYDGRTTVLHLKGGTTGTQRSWRLNWHFHRSMAIFYRTHNAGNNRPLDALVFSGIAVKWLSATVSSSGGRAVSRVRARYRPAAR